MQRTTNIPTADRAPPVQTLGDDLLSGIDAIAAFLGADERATYHLVKSGLLPGVFKIGRKWCALRSQLRAGIEDLAKRGVRK
jgi:hypothetical protein